MRKAFDRVSLFLTCLLLSASWLVAVEVAGTWTGTMSQKTDDGHVAKAAVVFHLNQKGNQVTGTAGPPDESPGPIREVKFEGNRLRFTVGAAPDRCGNSIGQSRAIRCKVRARVRAIRGTSSEPSTFR